jgi:hypothetical protein
MPLSPLRSTITFSAAVFFAAIAVSQVAENPDKETVRLTIYPGSTIPRRLATIGKEV